MAAPSETADESIIKLVFLREAGGGATSHRKAVVSHGPRL